MNSDYIFVFLIILIILLFFLAIRYFKYLLFYLWVFTWLLLSVYWSIFLEDKHYNLWFLKILFNNVNEFFKNSKIVQFLIDNLWYLFFLFIILLFHRFFYYLLLILLYFLKWLSVNTLNWISNRKDKKNKINDNIINKEDWQIENKK